MANKTAVVLGASGLIGSQVLNQLLTDSRYRQVTVLVRRAIHLSHPKLVQRIVNFDRLEQQAADFAVQDVFCCLGTTIKQAGSQEAFYRVDATYPAESARLAAQQGAQQFVLVTSMGADKNSRIFYNRVKGEVEAKINALPLPTFIIVRPSVLLGDRQDSRVGEAIGKTAMQALRFLLVGKLKKYRAIEAATVARAMIVLANQNLRGIHVFESDRLQELGE